MKLLFDFFPIALFFIAYKLFDIYVATSLAMGGALFQVIFHRIKYGRYEKLHLVGLALILILGSATLFFHNPWFIKCKPTGIYWLFSLILLGSMFFNKKNIIQTMMDHNINLPNKIWKRLNIAWALYFIMMGGLNLYVAYYYTTDLWVNFKLFGGIGCMLLFIFIQALYLSKYTVHSTSKSI